MDDYFIFTVKGGEIKMYKQKIIDEINRLIGEGYTYKDIFDTFKENGVKNVDGKSFTYDSLRYFIKINIKPKESKDTQKENKNKTNDKGEKMTEKKSNEDEKKKKIIKKVNYEKVSKLIDSFFTSTSLTIDDLSKKHQISKSSVSKIKGLLEKKYIPVIESTSLPEKYFKSSIEGFVIKKMFERGWKQE